MRIMMVAGDASGDIYGAELARKLKAMVPGVELAGAGGAFMAAAGVDIISDLGRLSAVGIIESAARLPAAAREFRRLAQVMTCLNPDCLVLIDFPGFNFRLAGLARRRGIKTVYFICPTVWAWGRGRAKVIARCVDRALLIFPFEEEIYREAGANAEFIGHPILDVMGAPLGRAKAREVLGLDQAGPVVALLPGSRIQEVRLLWPLMLEASRAVLREIPGITFIWPVAPGLPASVAAMSGPMVRTYSGHARECLEACDVAVVASGTATLEAAVLNTPMVIVYKVSPLTWMMARRLVKVPYVGLPNILAGREIVPELLQGKATVDRLSRWILQLFRDAGARNQVKEDLRKATGRLGHKGAIERAARVIAEVASHG
ncbi:MAG TPA: lipid-A-disaccharide synthase [Firmicutes bacterium]|nr:lipid-A-disaccharide synthase [Bacillota bacterium]